MLIILWNVVTELLIGHFNMFIYARSHRATFNIEMIPQNEKMHWLLINDQFRSNSVKKSEHYLYWTALHDLGFNIIIDQQWSVDDNYCINTVSSTRIIDQHHYRADCRFNDDVNPLQLWDCSFAYNHNLAKR